MLIKPIQIYSDEDIMISGQISVFFPPAQKVRLSVNDLYVRLGHLVCPSRESKLMLNHLYTLFIHSYLVYLNKKIIQTKTWINNNGFGLVKFIRQVLKDTATNSLKCLIFADKESVSTNGSCMSPFQFSLSASQLDIYSPVSQNLSRGFTVSKLNYIYEPLFV